jgi:hypothetical protein
MIKTQSGAAWLTLPVQKGDFHQRIDQVKLAQPQSEWIEKHLSLIRENYHPAAYFDRCFDQIETIYRSGHDTLVGFNMALMHHVLDEFGIDTPVVLSSEIGVVGQSTAKLVNLLEAVGGTHYVTGTGARDYLDENAFNDRGIALEWVTFDHPEYTQLHGDFVPGLSCMDAMFNCGPEAGKLLG